LFTRDTTHATLSMPMLKTPVSLQTGLVVRGQGRQVYHTFETTAKAKDLAFKAKATPSWPRCQVCGLEDSESVKRECKTSSIVPCTGR